MKTVELILKLLLEGKSKAQIAKFLSLSKSTVSYHSKRLGFLSPKSKSRDWTEVQEYYDQGYTIRECQVKFGFSRRSIQKATKKGLFITRKNVSLDLTEYLTDDKPKTSRVHLKRKLIQQGILKEICDECKLEPWWNGKKLVLHLDHINGLPKDNRLENLRLLCPNCHSQTETYAGKKTKRKLKKRVQKEETIC
jgi:transposase